MTESASTDYSAVANQVNSALVSLDAALVQAGQAITVIRNSVSQFATLAEVVQEMELAMARARDNLTLPTISRPATAAATPLRAVPPQEPAPQYAYEPADPVAEIETEEPRPSEPVTIPAPQDAGAAASHCLRLGVDSRAGSLDLKAVDGAVNENPAVVDVALLDYDGRHATLKLWINDTSDPSEVRDSLMASLQRRLGEEQEVRIDFEESAA
jgi:hypothetical protein